MRLASKTAIVTGIGAGIGEAIALRFAEEGARLVLADIQEAPGRATLQKVIALGAQAPFIKADISQEDGARSIAQAAISTFAAIDVLVNNAADFTQLNLEKAEISAWQHVLSVNLHLTARY